MQKALLFLATFAIIGVVFGADGDACTASGTAGSIGTIPDHCTAGTTKLTAGGTAYCDCTAVATGYFEASAGTTSANSVITQCHQACATCSAAGSDKCNSCATNYQADTTSGNTVSTATAGKCCPKSCVTCGVQATRTTDPECWSCGTGYGNPKLTPVAQATPGACVLCTGVNCLTCDTTTDATKGVCTSCPTATFASADNKTCTACPTNCNSCPNATYCTTCNNSLAWNNGSQKCYGSALKVGSVVGSLFAVAIFALVF